MRWIAYRLNTCWFQEAPPARLALLRWILGIYTLYYLSRRYKMYMRMAQTDPSLFKPVGAASHLRQPLPASAFRTVLVATLLVNIAFMVGWRHRYTGPLYASLLLWLLSYRNSWSMIYHNDNLLVLHAIILGLTPAADACSIDAVRRFAAHRHDGEAAADNAAHWRYGWPIQLINAVTIMTYFLSGVAKIKGPLGWKWASGEVLRSQVAVDGLRKEVLGEGAAPLAFTLYNQVTLFRVLAVGSLVLELAAPAVLLHKNTSRLWAIGAFLLHWGIFFIMKITFRYHLSGLLFASFFDIERIIEPFERKAKL